MTPYPLCEHIKTNGEFCQAPALSGQNRCFFHSTVERRRRVSARITRRQNLTDAIQIPPLEDANAIQVAIMETIDGLIDGRLTPKHAQIVLGALRTASVNLRYTDFEPDPDNAATEPTANDADSEPETAVPTVETPAPGAAAPAIAENLAEPELTDGRVPLALANYCQPHAPQP